MHLLPLRLWVGGTAFEAVLNFRVLSSFHAADHISLAHPFAFFLLTNAHVCL
jgi:hypothetical protein